MRISTILAAAATVILVLCCAALPLAGADRYYHEEFGFSLDNIANWQVVEGFMGAPVTFVSPTENAEDKFRENINVTVEDLPFTVTLENYFNLSVASLEKMMTDYSEHERAQLEINGVPARRIVFSHRIGAVDYRVLSYILVKGLHAYCLTCTALPETFAAYRSTFERVALTFRCGTGTSTGDTAPAPASQPTAISVAPAPSVPVQNTGPAVTPKPSAQEIGEASAVQAAPVKEMTRSPQARFSLRFEQSGNRIEIHNSQVILEKRPFTMVFSFDEPDGILVNFSSKSDLFIKAKEKKNLCDVMVAGAAVAEGLFNSEGSVVIADDIIHYWYYTDQRDHRFDLVQQFNSTIVCRRIVSRCVQGDMEMPIESVDLKALYVVVLRTLTGEYYVDTETQREYVKIVFE